jgi:hypothetical protein
VKKNNKMAEKPHTITESIKQEGLKGFFKRWGEGIKRIPPEKLLETELIGSIGTIIGTLVAALLFIFLMKNIWPISIILGFNVVVQTAQAIGKWQQLKAMKNIQTQSIDIEQFLKGGIANTNGS